MGALKVTMLGLRGFPGVQGGVEKHVEQLTRELAALGCDVEAIVRPGYLAHYAAPEYQGVKLRRLWAPKSKSLEAIVHSFLGVMVAAATRPDILHIHAIGPALVTPLARILGLRVVVTHHGRDYERQKWGRLAGAFLRLGEIFGAKFAHGRIAVSNAVARGMKERLAADSTVIPNGVSPPVRAAGDEAPRDQGLAPGRYILMVGRLVPEKRHVDAVRAFAKAGLEGWKLVIVGEGDFGADCAAKLDAASGSNSGIVRLGFQTGPALAQLYAHAGMFVLPSSHEGMPIALLEALSYGVPVIASDIEANVELGLPLESYFPLGNVDALARRIREIAAAPRRNDAATHLSEKYDWRSIAKQTLGFYTGVARPRQARFALFLFLMLASLLLRLPPGHAAGESHRFLPVLHRGVGICKPELWAQLKPDFTYVPQHLAKEGYLDAPILRTIRSAGFDFIRLVVVPGPFMQFKSPDRDALDTLLVERVQSILAADLSVIVDFHADSRSVAYGFAQLVGPGSAEVQPQYAAMLHRTALLLATLNSPRVFLEIMNEPKTSGTADGHAAWQQELQTFYAAARSATPKLGLILSGGDSGEPSGLLALDPAPFAADPQALFTFHYYFPLAFTAQGSPVQRSALYLADVPWPAHAHPLMQTVAATLERIADSDLSAADKARETVRTTQALAAYWAAGYGRPTVAADFDRIAGWARAHGIANDRILIGEFGVTRTYGQYHGAADPDRGRWLVDVREEAEAHRFPWSIWDWHGGGGMQITQAASATSIDPVVTRALGLRALSAAQ